MIESNWNSAATWNTPAPDELELVRRFVNTSKIPRGMRDPVDELPELLAEPRAWDERFPGWPVESAGAEERLTRLREDLRGTLNTPDGWAERLNGWFERYPLVARVVQEDQGPSVSYEPDPEAGFAGRILAAVAMSIDDGTFVRLKACPDCRWVFYDTSRSRTRVWCGMYAGEKGRACGTISKVKRYRQRRKADEQG